ncbi:MAG: DpnD/PcfM family protein [Clostridiales bacterium]|nr:DpnD/PcfM family protein [Clostridiales bacterium]
MKKYMVIIRETLEKEVYIEAETAEEAEAAVEYGWRNEDYILTADDFADVDYETEEIYD